MKAFALAAAALALLAAGCSGPTWPAPKATTDVVMDHAHRAALLTIGLGDAVHIELPPPEQAGMEWIVIIVNGRVLRQMMPIEPVPGRPGWAQVSFQAIHTVIRTELKFAAVPPNAQGFEPTDTYTFGIAVKHRSDLPKPS